MHCYRFILKQMQIKWKGEKSSQCREYVFFLKELPSNETKSFSEAQIPFHPSKCYQASLKTSQYNLYNHQREKMSSNLDVLHSIGTKAPQSNTEKYGRTENTAWETNCCLSQREETQFTFVCGSLDLKNTENIVQSFSGYLRYRPLK